MSCFKSELMCSRM